MKIALLALSSISITNAAILSGTGPHLPIIGPHHGGAVPGIPHTIAAGIGNWNGTWTTTAATPWVGTFSATGPLTGSGSSGTTRYDFTTLPTGNLPPGTMFLLGDVDSGSGVAENFDFRAWDSSGTLIDLWLDETIGTYSNGTGPGGTPLINNMPGWTWNSSTQSYNFTGTTVTGANPSLGVILQNNQNIAFMEVVKENGPYGFSLRAPKQIPEPSSILLSTLAGAFFAFRRKRNK